MRDHLKQWANDKQIQEAVRPVGAWHIAAAEKNYDELKDLGRRRSCKRSPTSNPRGKSILV